MITLKGKISVQRLSGIVNIVGSGGGGGPLQSKVIFPSHSEQIIAPDEDYYGLSLVTVKPTPRLSALVVSLNEGPGDIWLGDTVENIVIDGVAVSVGEEKWYTHFLYNGVKLPRIPDEVLETYPYALIRNDVQYGNYDLFVSKTGFYYDTNANTGVKDKGGAKIPRYKIPISDDMDNAQWTLEETTYTKYDITSTRLILWTNHDIPNGSADAIDIYFEATELVPTD